MDWWREHRRFRVLLGVALVAVVVVVVGPWFSAEGRFDRRERLPSCGHVELGGTGSVDDASWACLDAAWDTGAELSVMTPTTEGDPTYQYYRVGPGIDGLEVYRDTTSDTYGNGRWSHDVCPGEDVADARSSC